MAAKVRVGIVGATVTPGGSGWGANAHVPALHALPDFELKAVCTAHEETAKASAAAFGAELAFHDFEEMIAHPDIDLVAVVVRVPGHHGLVMSALEAGKAVFCEWPLGARLAEAEEMANLARARSVRHGGRPPGPQRPHAHVRARAGPAGLHRRDRLGELQRGQSGGDPAGRGAHLAGRPQERRQHPDDRRRARDRRALLRAGRARGGLGAPGDAHHRVAQHGHRRDHAGRFAGLDQRVRPPRGRRRGLVPRHDRAVQPERQSLRDLRTRRHPGDLGRVGEHRAEPAARGARRRAAGGDGDPRALHAGPGGHARGPGAERRPGVRASRACPGRGGAVRARLRPRRDATRADRGDRALVGRGRTGPPHGLPLAPGL